MTPPDSPRSRFPALAAVLFLAGLFAIAGRLAAADPSPKSFDLPAGQAERTLKIFSEQSGHEVLFPTGAVQDVQTRAVRGRYAPRAALDRMLDGTALEAREDEQTGAFAVGRRTAPPVVQSQPARPSPLRPETNGEDAPKEEIVMLSPFTVDVTKDRGYQATNSISATRLNTPVYELPLGMSIATEEFIRDIGTSDLQETMRYLTNTERDFAPQTTGQFNMRGSAMSNRGVFINSRQINQAVADNYNIARIEVIKGPASPIVGVSTPVGLINFLIKKPQLREGFSRWEVKVGDDDFFRTTLDVNQPFELFGRQSGVRVMAVHEDSKSFIPHESKRHKGVTMTNLTRLSDTLMLDTYIEYLEVDRTQPGVLAEAGIGHVGARAPYGAGGWNSDIRTATGGVIPAPSQVIGGQTVTTGMFVKDIYDIVQLASIAGPDNFQNFRTFSFDGSLVWQPADNFNVEAFFSAGRQFKDDMRKEGTNQIRYDGVTVVGGQAVFNPAGGRFFQRHQMFALPQPAVWRYYRRIAGMYDLKLPFMRQQFRFGVEDSKMTGRQQNQSRITVGGNRSQVLQLDTYLDEINYANTSIQRWYQAGGVMTPLQHTWLPDEIFEGVYATAQGSYLNNRVRTVLGYRQDDIRLRAYRIYQVPQGGSFAADPKELTSDSSYSQSSPIYSISVEPIRGLSLYYNKSKSISFTQAGGPILLYGGTVNDDPFTAVAQGRFDPNNAQGPPPPPETGEGEEFGAKLSLFGGRLSASLARYTNERVNIRSTWPSTYIRDLFPSGHPLATQQFTALGVVQEAEGWEFELQASPTESLTFSIGYAEPKVEFTTNPINPAVVGAASAGVFKSTINAVARYSFTRGPLKGAYAGTSFQYRGAWRESNNFGGVFLPSYTVWNPFLGYDWKPADRWQAGVRLDVRNALDETYVTRHIVGEPLSVFLSAHLRFK